MKYTGRVVFVAALLTSSWAAASPFVVNEVVTDPQSDWSTNGFDGTDGASTVSDVDQYIELKNNSASAESLDGRVLVMVAPAGPTTTNDCFGFASTPPSGICTTAGTYIVLDSTGSPSGSLSAVPAGGYVIVGNPSGAMPDDVELSIIDTNNANEVEDSITASGNANADATEAFARFPDGGDTDLVGDFRQIKATLGASNGAPCSLSAGAALINEVVTDPQRDWSTDGFVGTVGGTTVTATDEYVEVFNASGGLLDLTNCFIDFDGGEEFHFQDVEPATQVVQVFSPAGTHLGGASFVDEIPNNGYVILGNPPPSNVTNTELITLYGSTTIDSMDLGNGIPDGNAGSLLDESVSRFTNGVSTIEKLAASPGAFNGGPCEAAVGDVVINEVVTDPQRDWSDTANGGGALFDSLPGDATPDEGDEFVELLNTSGATIDIRWCRVHFADSTPTEMILQGVDDTSVLVVSVFRSDGTYQGGAQELVSVEDGGFVVIGNPPGGMNNDITVEVSVVDGTVDSVDFDGDAPNLNASEANDESGARVPNGTDTDVGANDFFQQPATPGTNNELDECALGLDNCSDDADCANIPARFTCACNSGYTGDGVTCEDIDECDTGGDDCGANAACTNTVGSFTCACAAGFEGDGYTCADIDECDDGSADCPENSTCTNSTGSFSCTCDEGYEGNRGECAEVGTASSGGGCNATSSGSTMTILLTLLALGLTRRRGSQSIRSSARS